MTLVVEGPPSWCVDVLNPSCVIAAIKSLFWTGLASVFANKLLAKFVSCPLYALTAMIGTFAFLFAVLLM